MQTERDFHPQNEPRTEAHLQDYEANVKRSGVMSRPHTALERAEKKIRAMWNGTEELPRGFEHLIHAKSFDEFKSELFRTIWVGA